MVMGDRKRKKRPLPTSGTYYSKKKTKTEKPSATSESSETKKIKAEKPKPLNADYNLGVPKPTKTKTENAYAGYLRSDGPKPLSARILLAASRAKPDFSESFGKKQKNSPALSAYEDGKLGDSDQIDEQADDNLNPNPVSEETPAVALPLAQAESDEIPKDPKNILKTADAVQNRFAANYPFLDKGVDTWFDSTVGKAPHVTKEMLDLFSQFPPRATEETLTKQAQIIADQIGSPFQDGSSPESASREEIEEKIKDHAADLANKINFPISEDATDTTRERQASAQAQAYSIFAYILKAWVVQAYETIYEGYKFAPDLPPALAAEANKLYTELQTAERSPNTSADVVTEPSSLTTPAPKSEAEQESARAADVSDHAVPKDDSNKQLESATIASLSPEQSRRLNDQSKEEQDKILARREAERVGQEEEDRKNRETQQEKEDTATAAENAATAPPPVPIVPPAATSPSVPITVNFFAGSQPSTLPVITEETQAEVSGPPSMPSRSGNADVEVTGPIPARRPTVREKEIYYEYYRYRAPHNWNPDTNPVPFSDGNAVPFSRRNQRDVSPRRQDRGPYSRSPEYAPQASALMVEANPEPAPTTDAKPEPVPAETAMDAKPEPVPAETAMDAKPEPVKMTDTKPEPVPAETAMDAKPEPAPVPITATNPDESSENDKNARLHELRLQREKIENHQRQIENERAQHMAQIRQIRDANAAKEELNKQHAEEKSKIAKEYSERLKRELKISAEHLEKEKQEWAEKHKKATAAETSTWKAKLAKSEAEHEAKTQKAAAAAAAAAAETREKVGAALRSYHEAMKTKHAEEIKNLQSKLETSESELNDLTKKLAENQAEAETLTTKMNTAAAATSMPSTGTTIGTQVLIQSAPTPTPSTDDKLNIADLVHNQNRLEQKVSLLLLRRTAKKLTGKRFIKKETTKQKRKAAIALLKELFDATPAALKELLARKKRKTAKDVPRKQTGKSE